MTYILIDGMNMLFRCFYGIPELTTKQGFPTNAIHGWVKALGMLEDWGQANLKESQAMLIVFFDAGGMTRQKRLYSDYKAHRKEAPESFKQQIEPIKAITDSWGIPIVEQEGVEADDWIASFAAQMVVENHDVIIVSSDKDFAQCLEPRVSQLLPPPTANPRLGWRWLQYDGVEEKFGVTPGQIPAMLALMGDSSDNIAGVPGAGPKTVTMWLKTYGTLEAILDAKEYIQPARFQSILQALESTIRINMELVTLKKDLHIPSLHSKQPNETVLWRLLSDLEMDATLRDVKRRFAVKSNTLILE